MTDGNEWWLNGHLNVPAIHSCEWALKGHWMVSFSFHGMVAFRLVLKALIWCHRSTVLFLFYFPFFRFFKLFHSFSSCWHSLNLRYYLFGIWHFCPFLNFPSSAPCRSFLMLYTILVNVFIFLTMFPCINIVDWGSWWHLDQNHSALLHDYLLAMTFSSFFLWHSFASASPG